MTLSCSVVVLNYQGLEELKRCFPSVVAACKADNGIHELILLDNHSEDGSPEWVEKHFPKVRVVRRPDNLVCHAFNEIAKSLTCEFCIFLNNDLVVEKTFIQKVLKHFKDQKVIAVSPLLVPYSPEREASPTLATIPKNVHRVRFTRGFLEMIVAPISDATPKNDFTFHISSYGAYRREKFLELGGYDLLLFPTSWIDVDFSYRLWKADYKVVHERETFVLDSPPGNTTNRVLGHRRALLSHDYNKLLTTWLNITDKKLLLKSIAFGFLDFMRALLGLHPSLVIPFLMCLKKTPAILKARKRRKRFAKLSDLETLKRINEFCT